MSTEPITSLQAALKNKAQSIRATIAQYMAAVKALGAKQTESRARRATFEAVKAELEALKSDRTISVDTMIEQGAKLNASLPFHESRADLSEREAAELETAIPSLLAAAVSTRECLDISKSITLETRGETYATFSGKWKAPRDFKPVLEWPGDALTPIRQAREQLYQGIRYNPESVSPKELEAFLQLALTPVD